MIKMKKFVEDHCDDLGDDLAGLGGDLEYHMADVAIAPTTKMRTSTASMSSASKECLRGGSGEKGHFLNAPLTQ